MSQLRVVVPSLLFTPLPFHYDPETERDEDLRVVTPVSNRTPPDLPSLVSVGVEKDDKGTVVLNQGRKDKTPDCVRLDTSSLGKGDGGIQGEERRPRMVLLSPFPVDTEEPSRHLTREVVT